MIWLIMTLNLMAQDILIQPQKMPDIEFQKHLMDHPQKISFSKSLAMKKDPLEEKIHRKMKLAQFEFIKGSLERAQKIFTEISDMRFNIPWKLKERKIIHYASLRAAQLESDDSLKSQYLKQASLFDSNLKIDSELFPPPMVSEYKKIKKSQKNQIWALPKGSENFHSLRVNGRSSTINNGFVRIPKGRFHFQFLSDKWAPYHITTETSDLEKLTIIPEPLSKQGCIQAIASQYLSNGAKPKILNETCQMLMPSNPASPLASQTPRPKHSTKKSSSIFGSKWFWIGASVLATGLAYHSLSRKSSPSPSEPNQPKPSSPKPTVISNH